MRVKSYPKVMDKTNRPSGSGEEGVVEEPGEKRGAKRSKHQQSDCESSSGSESCEPPRKTRKRSTDESSRLRQENERLLNLLKFRERAPMDLVKFDPKFSDAMGWAKMVDTWITHYKLDDWELVQHLAKAFQGDAGPWFMSINPAGKNWLEIRAEFLSTYAQNRNAAHELYAAWEEHSEFTMENFMKRGRRIKSWLTDRKNMDEMAAHLTGLSYSFRNRFVRNIFVRENPTTLQEAMSFLEGRTAEFQKSRGKGDNSSRQTGTSSSRENSTGRLDRSNVECFNCGKRGHYKSNCRYPPKFDPKDGKAGSKGRDSQDGRKKIVCYACNEVGHIAPNCPTKLVKGEKAVKLCKATSTQNHLKLSNGKVLPFLFDSGSDCSLVKQSTAERLPGTRRVVSTRLRGLGNGHVDCIEQICVAAEVSGLKIEVELFVVPDDYLSDDLILGKELLADGVSVSMDGTTVRFTRTDKFVGSCSQEILIDEIDCGSQAKKEPLVKLLNSLRDHVSVHAPKIRVKTGQCEVRLENPNQIVQRRPYKLGTCERETVRELVDEMLEAGIVRESKSPFSSPIILVKKKDGSDRLCVDFRELNSNTVADRYPIPLIQDQLDRLCGALYFSSLDMVAGFHQIPVEEKSIEKLAFVTPDGHYEYLSMPFGLKNAPSVYQRAINNALGDLRHSLAIVYLDDVLIPGKSEDEAMNRLEIVMKTLAEQGFSFNLKKCKFLQQQIDYLGYTVSNGELRPNVRKIEALTLAPVPKTQTQVRQLLGLASYFRRFIPRFSEIASPLYKLTAGKTKTIHWTDEHTRARDTLNKHLSSEPLIRIFDPELPIELHTDASSLGYGAVLLQKIEKEKHPVAYYSKRTSDAESRYHSYELETLAVVNSIKHFRQYLVGKKFLVVTDCNSLKSASQKKDLTPRVYRWWAFLQSFDFDIEYRAGERMKHADFLSRNPIESKTVMQVTHKSSEEIAKEKDNEIIDLEDDWLIVAQQQDDNIRSICHEVTEGSEATKTYELRERILMKKINRNSKTLVLPVVPRNMIWSVIHHVHTSICHLGWEKTLDKIYELYWFPCMSKRVKKFVANCILCQTCKSVSRKNQAQLHPIEKVSIPWHTIHIDISGKLSGVSEKKEYVFVTIDGFTKFVTLNLITRLNAETAIEQIERHTCTFGSPKRIICDQGAGFTNVAFKTFCEENNIELHIMASGTPRANGQVERVMLTLRNLLSIAKAQNKIWQKELGRTQLALNSTVHKVLGKSPAEILFGTQINSVEIEKIRHDSAEEKTVGRDETRALAQKKIAIQAEKEKEKFDSKNAEVVPFKVNSFVLVRSNDRIKTKLDAKFEGPYEVIKILDNDRYAIKRVKPKSKRCFKVAHDRLIAAPSPDNGQEDSVAGGESGEIGRGK